MSDAACDLFTTDSYVHAHDLGRVPCVKCGRLFQEHNSDQRHSVPPTSNDVVAVLAEALQARFPELRWKDRRFAVEDIFAALTAAGYAVVALPDGVAVAHGSRVVRYRAGMTRTLYVIEPAP